MPICDAVIQSIPAQTKAEAKEYDAHNVQDIFAGEDITGLDLNFGRNRKIKAESVEEYLKTLDYIPREEAENQEVQDSSKPGIFKCNYKMKLVDFQNNEGTSTSPWTKSSLDSPCKASQISSASTKSDVKIPQTDENPLFEKIEHDKKNNIIERLLANNSEHREIGFTTKRGSLTLTAACEAKIFKTKESVALVSKMADVARSIEDGLAMAKIDVLPKHSVEYAEKNQGIVGVFENTMTSKFVGGIADVYISTRKSATKKEAAGKPATVFFSVVVEQTQLLVLEFKEDEELSEQKNLNSVYICHLKGNKNDSFSSKVLENLNSRIKQEGYFTMKKFISRLLSLGTSKCSSPATAPSMKSARSRSTLIHNMDFEDMQLYSSTLNKRQMSSCKASGISGFDLTLQEDTYCMLPSLSQDIPSVKESSFSL